MRRGGRVTTIVPTIQSSTTPTGTFSPDLSTTQRRVNGRCRSCLSTTSSSYPRAQRALAAHPHRPRARSFSSRIRGCKPKPAESLSKGHQEPRLVPERRGDSEVVLPGAAQHRQEMDHADPRLESGTEPVYDTVRGQDAGAVNEKLFTQKFLHPPGTGR